MCDQSDTLNQELYALTQDELVYCVLCLDAELRHIRVQKASRRLQDTIGFDATSWKPTSPCNDTTSGVQPPSDAEGLPLRRRVDLLEFQVQQNHVMFDQERSRKFRLEEEGRNASRLRYHELDAQQKRLSCLQRQVDHQRTLIAAREAKIEEQKADLHRMQQDCQRAMLTVRHDEADTQPAKDNHSPGSESGGYHSLRRPQGSDHLNALKQAAHSARLVSRKVLRSSKYDKT